MLKTQPLRYIRERDIDLLLLEEFHCSQPFQQWFLAQMAGSIPESAQFCTAAHSVVSPNGESDLVVDFSDGTGTLWGFLIENKVDAEFQPEQPERYAERKQDYVQSDRCTHCCTVIIAPSNYLESHAKENEQFDRQLSYEALRDWFQQQPDDHQRNWYKANLISIAITQGVYQPDFSVLATENWQWLHHQMAQLAPEIRLPKLSRRHTNGGWKTLTAQGTLPGQLYIIYKSERGYVDLTFPGKGPQANAAEFYRFQEFFQPRLLPEMSIAAACKSAVIRIEVTPTQITEPFSQQALAIQEAIEAARKLNQWVRGHQDAIEGEPLS